ncbi:hypothetical protein PPYR_00623 [Photinus pyralis]|uniref:Receptor expression-enhancing protein n=1 Tax=Photinus pyralis TaxID=7054 RepID=A0A1Y1LGS0_PHOPY|nr:receptor expression-enhancing protein 5-like [Photinus pyralis]KAB0803653.1 hypothetical protein PPYR_00623 [Photinus pyralis]
MAAKVMEIKEKLEATLNDGSKPWTAILAQIEAKTGINRVYIFFVSVAGLALWLMFGFAGQLVCNCVGFLYPAYVSIHAIETPHKDDDTKWLTYWVVYALFSLVEFFADIIVGWFPMYWLLKCVFMVWLMIPTEFNGSLILYNRIIKPYYLQHHSRVDDTINKVRQEATKILEKQQ